MKVTREEVDSLMRLKPRPDLAVGPASEMLRQAQIATEHLTGMPEWDVFLQRVQVWIDEERQRLAAMAENMPPNMTSEQVLQAHRFVIESRTKVQAWEQVLRLPKEILAAKAGTQPAAA